MIGTAIVYDAVTMAKRDTFAFDVWHANHYVPSVLGGRPFDSVQRYGSPALASYVTVFEVGSPPDAGALSALPRPENPALGTSYRFSCEPAGEYRAKHATEAARDADLVYPVFFKVPPDRAQEFDDWYDREHLNILLRSPHWQMCRRFRIIAPTDAAWTHLALHYLSDLKALESPERDEARATPWRDRLAREDWFRGVYEVHYRLGQRITFGA